MSTPVIMSSRFSSAVIELARDIARDTYVRAISYGTPGPSRRAVVAKEALYCAAEFYKVANEAIKDDIDKKEAENE